MLINWCVGSTPESIPGQHCIQGDAQGKILKSVVKELSLWDSTAHPLRNVIFSLFIEDIGLISWRELECCLKTIYCYFKSYKNIAFLVQEKCHRLISSCAALLSPTVNPGNNARPNPRTTERWEGKGEWFTISGHQQGVLQILPPQKRKETQSWNFLNSSLAKEGCPGKLISFPDQVGVRPTPLGENGRTGRGNQSCRQGTHDFPTMTDTPAPPHPAQEASQVREHRQGGFTCLAGFSITTGFENCVLHQEILWSWKHWQGGTCHNKCLGLEAPSLLRAWDLPPQYRERGSGWQRQDEFQHRSPAQEALHLHRPELLHTCLNHGVQPGEASRAPCSITRSKGSPGNMRKVEQKRGGQDLQAKPEQCESLQNYKIQIWREELITLQLEWETTINWYNTKRNQILEWPEKDLKRLF